MSLGRVLITGGAGFIGSNVADALLARGDDVVIYDNLRTGRREFIADALERNAKFVEGDVLDLDSLTAAMSGCDAVIHLAANADVRHGLEHPRRDLEQNTIATSNVLEAMRAAGVGRIAFSSTGSVYGEPEVFPTPEDAPFPVQTSLYAASKLAGEGMIAAYATGFGLSAVIFRFVSILGERYTHGHVFDFWRSLRDDAHTLRVLGDGKQEKSYLYIGDCVAGIFRGLEEHQEQTGAFIYNLGHTETVVVDDSVAHICSELGVSPAIEHTGGRRGWTGDSPLIHLDCGKIRGLGWQPQLSIKEGISRTVSWLSANPYVLEGIEKS
ncbi:MAG TPA: SDR family NAD(P)-dependent oxidoreductase [Jatrophihabitans sp.]|jgi:UDP-glucose 4-epimerase